MKKLGCLLIAALVVGACNKDKSTFDASKGEMPMPEAIDIGLEMTRPDGTTYNLKWASFNLGASKEYEFGNYYAWGELAPKSDYSWETYALANGDYESLTSYCAKDRERFWDMTAKPDGPDGVMRLKSSDDVAQEELGGKWRMPTLDDILALLALKEAADEEGSDYIWDQWASVTNDKGEEINGTRITRKSTGATLFIPASGVSEGTNLAPDAGSRGGFWTASLNPTSPTFAHILIVLPSVTQVAGLNRQKGLPVRPVCED